MKEHLAPTELKIRWFLKLVWTFWRREKSLTPTGNRTMNPRLSTPQPSHYANCTNRVPLKTVQWQNRVKAMCHRTDHSSASGQAHKETCHLLLSSSYWETDVVFDESFEPHSVSVCVFQLVDDRVTELKHMCTGCCDWWHYIAKYLCTMKWQQQCFSQTNHNTPRGNRAYTPVLWNAENVCMSFLL